MKKIVLSFLVIMAMHVAMAQSEAENKIRDEMWGQATPEFKTKQVPEKWKNESAVILAYQREYVADFVTRMRGLAGVKYFVQKIHAHYRIKLQDKAAVEDFSELAFNNKTMRTNLFGKASEYSVMGIKVIKPNGSEKEVDFKAAVKADAGSSKDFKIAIPNLEPGDIIDYFIAVRDETAAAPEFGDEEILEGKYPIVSQTLSFRVHRNLHFYAASLNGAPNFKETSTGEEKSYIIRDAMREKSPDIPWNYAYRTAPQFRYFLRKGDEKPNLKKEGQRLLSYFDNNPADIGYMVDFMRGNFKGETNPKKIVHELYYLLRNPIYLKAYFNIEQGTPLNADAAPDIFFYLMDKYLNKFEIDHQILLVPSRTMGPLSTLSNFQGCDLMLKVNTKPAIYIYRPTPFGMPNQFPYVFEGMQGVSKTAENAKPLPESLVDQNTTSSTIQIALHPADNTKLNLKRTVEVAGHNKGYYQYMVVTNYDYLKEYDLPKYQVESSRLMGGIIKQYNKEKLKYEQRIAQDQNERDSKIKKEIETEFDVKVTDYKLTLKSAGMWDASPNVIFNDEFTAENLTKKAGPNIIVEIGRLLERQPAIKEEQKNRSLDVYMDYARTFNYNFTLTIPDGYTVEGVENLNNKTENATGGFVSTAAINGKTLVIKAKKYYVNNFYKAADWPSITSFLNTVQNFYNAKILLKKV